MNAVPMKEVKSRQVHSVGHDAATNTLHMRFHNKTGPSATYVYPGITADMHKSLMTAESIGNHFNTHIKGNPKHPHQKLEAKAARP